MSPAEARPGDRPRLLGAVLAGGRGTRMGGAPKALLERTPGVPLVGHLLDEMARVPFAEIILLATGAEPLRRFGRPVVPDRRPDRGPLAGIEAGLERAAATGADGALFLPCDLPALTAAEIARLADAFRLDPRGIKVAVVSGGRAETHPLCCVAHRDVLPEIRAALDRGHLGVGRLWQDLGATPVPFDDPRPFRNLNSPVDLQAWNQERTP